jgi:hypothetical protein
MPFAIEPKLSNVLLYLSQLVFNTIKPLIMSTNGCPKGLHSMFFVIGVVAYVFVIYHQVKIVKALIPIDVVRSDKRERETMFSIYRINTHVDREN